ncbi:MAG: DUF721 domain-containing protein [Candidatus Berkiella sp.]
MSFATQPIQDLLSKSETQLSKLVSQANAIAALTQTFVSVLDNDLIPYCRVGCYESGVLTLFADNAAVATRLRYCTPTILSKLRSQKEWAGLCSIQVKVQTQTHHLVKPKEPEVLPQQVLSQENAKQIQALADALKDKPGMEKIVESLERIAKKNI